MKTIRRYDLAIEPIQKLSIPFNSNILKLGEFQNKPCLWVLVDMGTNEMVRSFVMMAEGKELPQKFNETNYIGCFEAKAEVGKHVLHVFEDT